MKKILSLAALSLFLMFLCCDISFAKTGKGLLIVAHGSHSKEWNMKVAGLEKKVSAILKKRRVKGFDYVKAGFLETAPFISDSVEFFEKRDVGEIYVVPLFFVASSHLSKDIPTILGIYNDKKMVDEVRKEGLKIVKSDIRIVMGPPLCYGDVLKEIMTDRVKSLSKNPNREALVILSHGSDKYEYQWNELIREISFYVTGRTGISFSDSSYVQVGQSMNSNGLPVIQRAGEKRERVIVVGLYLGRGVKKMAVRFLSHSEKGRRILENKRFVFGEKGILPDARVARWIVERGVDFLETGQCKK